MARTRSKGGASTAAAEKTASATTSSSKSRYTLPPESSTPPKVFILPQKATADARIVSLFNPCYSKPTRYLVCPETGIYEFTRIAAPTSTPRSWFIECHSGTEEEKRTNGDPDNEEFDAYVTKGAELFIATAVDPVFLVLPVLAADTAKSEKRMFLSSDDHFDSISKEQSPHFSEVLKWEKVRRLLESRMAAICDTVEAGDESMFRLSEEKLFDEILSKAKRMSEQPLPQSMEQKFVVKALEAPVLGVKRQTTTISTSEEKTELGATKLDASPPQVESQSSVSSTETTTIVESQTSTTVATSITEETVSSSEVVASIQASAEVTRLQRIRTAFSFICSSYIPPSQTLQLKQMLSENKDLVDFTPLDEYLAEMAKLRQEAVASRSVNDYSKKRVLDDEEAMQRAEKKRKKEEEEKRQKAGQSRGVRNLQKVNTAGMKKMSDFFKKK